MPKVLLVEDDPGIAEPLARALTRDGYEVALAANGQSAIDQAETADLMLLDLGLPDIDGTEVARALRKAGLTVPILVLTARADEVDKVLGLESGADDYVTKPFRLAELLSRVRALIKRGQSEPTAVDEFVAQEVRVNKGTRKAYLNDDELVLTAKEFDLLRVLVENAGNVVLRETLMKDVWGNDPQGSTKALESHISALRRKLADDVDKPQYITTAKGLGYKFETE